MEEGGWGYSLATLILLLPTSLHFSSCQFVPSLVVPHVPKDGKSFKYASLERANQIGRVEQGGQMMEFGVYKYNLIFAIVKKRERSGSCTKPLKYRISGRLSGSQSYLIYLLKRQAEIVERKPYCQWDSLVHLLLTTTLNC